MIYRSESRDLSLFLAGDVMLSRRLSVFTEPDYLALVERCRAADLAFANLETVVRHPEEGIPNFTQGTPMTTPPVLLDDLKWFGFGVLSNANNHATDYGVGGVEASRRHLRAAGLPCAGAGATLAEARAPAYADTPAGRVALVAATAFYRPWNRAADQRPDSRGRPGINPLGFSRIHTLPEEELAALRRIAEGLGLTQEAARHRTIFYSETEAPREQADRLTFLGGRFKSGPETGIATIVDRADADANLAMIREARRQADWVVFSFHFHEIGGPLFGSALHEAELDAPADFVRAFAHEAVEAGADIVVGHGPHMTLGVEIHKGRPILYSLGNFVFQNDTVEVFPAEAYARFGLGHTATPADFLDVRTGNGSRGFPVHPEYWRGLAAECVFKRGELATVRLLPVDLGYERGRAERGRPVLARDDVAEAIIARVERASMPFGTLIRRDGETAIVRPD